MSFLDIDFAFGIEGPDGDLMPDIFPIFSPQFHVLPMLLRWGTGRRVTQVIRGLPRKSPVAPEDRCAIYLSLKAA